MVKTQQCLRNDRYRKITTWLSVLIACANRVKRWWKMQFSCYVKFLIRAQINTSMFWFANLTPPAPRNAIINCDTARTNVKFSQHTGPITIHKSRMPRRDNISLLICNADLIYFYHNQIRSLPTSLRFTAPCTLAVITGIVERHNRTSTTNKNIHTKFIVRKRISRSKVEAGRGHVAAVLSRYLVTVI